jgi:hypothetical protein
MEAFSKTGLMTGLMLPPSLSEKQLLMRESQFLYYIAEK